MKIVTHETDPSELAEYSHLMEYQVKPGDLPSENENFRVREIFPVGNLLCGDLIINEEFTEKMELHPFPEWVTHLLRLDTKLPQVAGYSAIIAMSKKDHRKLSKLDWRSKIKQAREIVKNCTMEDIVLFKLVPGACAKINGNVIHYAIADKKPDTSSYPYWQVFEPSIDWNQFKPFGKFDNTGYFTLPFKLEVP